MITIEISDHNALVLHDFLAREIDGRKAARLAAAIEHPAEFWALNAVHCSLEATLAEPLAENYRGLVAAARGQVIAESDPDGTFGPIGGEAGAA